MLSLNRPALQELGIKFLQGFGPALLNISNLFLP